MSRKRLKKRYIRFINFLHRPFLKRSSEDPYHHIFGEFLELTKQVPDPRILELGSRNVTGITRRDAFPNCGEFVGFDYHAGEGVDVVGDAHKLSESLPASHFDFVFSVMVFEHLLYPWKVILELNKVMKPGGYVFLSTTPAWPAHELPWDFWRFLEGAFHGLLNKHTGFEIIKVVEGLPGKMYAMVDDPVIQKVCFHQFNQGVAVIARKTGDYNSDLLKWDIDIADVVDNIYPEPQT